MTHPTSLSAGGGVPILDQEIVTSTLVSPPHVLHTADDVAAIAEAYVPLAQPSQLAEPWDSTYVPAEQSLQTVDSVWPNSEEYLPSEQLVHGDALSDVL